MSTSVYFLTICLPLLTVLLVYGMKTLAALRQADAVRTQDASYRQLAGQVTQMQAETAAQLAAIRAALARLEQRSAAVEQILKQVE